MQWVCNEAGCVISAVHQAVDSVRNDEVTYASAYEILPVSLQPLEGQLNATLYGTRLLKMLLLLTNEPTALLPEGAGVCVDVAIDALPDYRVASSKDLGAAYRGAPRTG